MTTFPKLLAAIASALLFVAAAFAADASPAGKWQWTVQGRGGQGFEQSVRLEYKDGKLSGTLAGMQRGEFSVPDTPIRDASFEGGVVKFAVTREFGGNAFTTRYEGKLDGDAIQGSYVRDGFNGGEPVKRDWHARRVK